MQKMFIVMLSVSETSLCLESQKILPIRHCEALAEASNRVEHSKTFDCNTSARNDENPCPFVIRDASLAPLNSHALMPALLLHALNRRAAKNRGNLRLGANQRVQLQSA